MKLIAQKREAKGTGAVRRLRRESWIPAVIYGEGRAGEVGAEIHDTKPPP